MTNEVTIKILKGLIEDQRRNINTQEEIIKDHTIRMKRLESNIKKSSALICNCNEAIETYQK